MEAKAKEVNWAVPILIVTVTALTLIALVSWVQVVIGVGMSNSAPFGGNGMMINTADTGPADSGGNPAIGCGEMLGDPDLKELHDNCLKTNGGTGGNIQQQTNDTTNKTL